MIWIEADTLAKAAYSTILVDLGQTKPESNILTDTKLLTDFTSSFTGLKSAVNLFPGPANDSYAVLGKSTGPLGIKPSVILTFYVCQVPRLKPAGNLIVAVIVADLVLLQAVWQLYKLATEAYLSRVRPDMNPSGAVIIEQPVEPETPPIPSSESGVESFPLMRTSRRDDNHFQDGRGGP
ncbi:Ff.00g041270.m01.CDS01 [Fusarium sp. VM40]|nr:Ff.00g041270.m01.CDS01 [Fusarium sp. VM40]